MENIEENVVTKGAAAADPMPSSGIPVEDLGGPTPENYKPDDDSAKLKDPAATLAQVKDVVNAKAAKAEAERGRQKQKKLSRKRKQLLMKLLLKKKLLKRKLLLKQRKLLKKKSSKKKRKLTSKQMFAALLRR